MPIETGTQVNKLSQADTWKLGQWLNEKELTTDDTRSDLARQAAEIVGRKVTESNVESLLAMVGKEIPNIRTMDSDQRVRILARSLRALMLQLNVPVSSDLDALC